MIDYDKLERLGVDAQKLHDRLSEVIDDFDKHLSLKVRCQSLRASRSRLQTNKLRKLNL